MGLFSGGSGLHGRVYQIAGTPQLTHHGPAWQSGFFNKISFGLGPSVNSREHVGLGILPIIMIGLSDLDQYDLDQNQWLPPCLVLREAVQAVSTNMDWSKDHNNMH
jgi:hypothetical protein